MRIKQRLLGKLTRERLDPFIARHASEGRTLIVGAANGKYLEHFPNRVVLDVRKTERVDVVGDVHALPFPDNSFDMIVCTEVLEHLHTPQQAIDEMRRVLVPGGTLLLTTRFIAPIHDAPGDYFRFTRYGLAHLLREWEIASLEEEMGTMETFGHLLQRVAYQTNLRGGTFTKALVLVAARLVGGLQFFIKREYGVRAETEREERIIMTAGYYVIARKRA